MMRYPARCRKCRGRKTFAKSPLDRKCPCGGLYVVDSYRRTTENKRTNCNCSGLPWSLSGPHRRGSSGTVNGIRSACYYMKET